MQKFTWLQYYVPANVFLYFIMNQINQFNTLKVFHRSANLPEGSPSKLSKPSSRSASVLEVVQKMVFASSVTATEFTNRAILPSIGSADEKTSDLAPDKENKLVAELQLIKIKLHYQFSHWPCRLRTGHQPRTACQTYQRSCPTNDRSLLHPKSPLKLFRYNLSEVTLWNFLTTRAR